MADPKLEARDPNTSLGRLAELLYGFADDVLANPSLPLILLENPGWLNEAQIEPLLKLLGRPTLPDYLVRALTQHHKPAIATNALMHVALGEEVSSWEPCLQNLAALNCSKDDRAILEKHELIPDWLKSYLEPLPIPKQVRSNPRKPKAPPPFSEDQKQTLLRDSIGRQQFVAQSSKSPEEIEFLLEQFPQVVYAYAAKNPITPLLQLEKLMEDSHCWFALAANPSMTPELLDNLATRIIAAGQKYILDQIALNPNCTPELAARLRKEGVNLHNLVRFCTSEELQELFQSGYSWVAERARTRDDAPKWLIAEGMMQEIQKRRAYLPWFCGLLALDDQKRLTKNVRSANWFTRFAIAIHPSTKPKALEKLIDDANRYVRFAAKARLRDTTWVFPPAACGGQGEKS